MSVCLTDYLFFIPSDLVGLPFYTLTFLTIKVLLMQTFFNPPVIPFLKEGAYL